MMKRHWLLVVPIVAVCLFLGYSVTQRALSNPGPNPMEGPTAPEKKFEDFDKVVKGARETEGLFRLHRKDDHLYAELQPTQLEKPYLMPISIARGSGLGGFTLNFDEQWVILFKRVGDKVQVIRRNVRFTAKSGTPEARAVETTYADSILLAIPIKAIHPGRQSLLINLNDIFMQDFADLGMGSFDANRSSWHKVKAFPKNVELQISATFSTGRMGMMGMMGNDSVIDSRGTSLVVHYGLCELPSDAGFTPRLADDRVGYFLSATKDFSNDSRDDSYVRFVNRWRLERAEPIDPKRPDKLSAPKKKIVFWIENTVPDEYRAFVREGILEWNKAFEKVGFRDAIEVRQQENEDFDPEDINYNTFRWIATDAGFAMGPSRANPLTGELMDADIIFDAAMVRFWKQEYHLLTPSSTLSHIEASRTGWNLFREGTDPNMPRAWNLPCLADIEKGKVDPRHVAMKNGICQCASHMRHELALAALALVAQDKLKPGEKVPDELIGQAIKHVVMHEVGHTLGLRHNFKASSTLKNEQLHDTTITRKQGIVGSVMDYSPVNLAPKGTKQGDYFSVVLGQYDYWAIEYAYKPLSGGTDGEREELKKIAQKGAQAGHDFGTDEDMFGTADPTINVWDLGSDPARFSQDRLLLAEELFKGLADRVVDKGEGYQKVRLAFGMLLGQYADAAYLTSQMVGGEYANRDHRGDPNGRDPMIPVKGDKQREALKWLKEHILTDKHFQFSPELLRRLAAERWYHWGTEYQVMQPIEYPINQSILSIQRIALRNLLNAQVMQRVQNNATKADKDDKSLTIAEIFSTLTDSIWADVMTGSKKVNSSVTQRNLQREHLGELIEMVVGRQRSMSAFEMFFMGRSASVPADAKSLARSHLRTLRAKIDLTLSAKGMEVDETTRAHLEECQERIVKAMSASVQVHQP